MRRRHGKEFGKGRRKRSAAVFKRSRDWGKMGHGGTGQGAFLNGKPFVPVPNGTVGGGASSVEPLGERFNSCKKTGPFRERRAGPVRWTNSEMSGWRLKPARKMGVAFKKGTTGIGEPHAPLVLAEDGWASH